MTIPWYQIDLESQIWGTLNPTLNKYVYDYLNAYNRHHPEWKCSFTDVLMVCTPFFAKGFIRLDYKWLSDYSEVIMDQLEDRMDQLKKGFPEEIGNTALNLEECNMIPLIEDIQWLKIPNHLIDIIIEYTRKENSLLTFTNFNLYLDDYILPELIKRL